MKGCDSGDLGGRKNLVQRKNKRTYLPATGLLMEGRNPKGASEKESNAGMLIGFRTCSVGIGQSIAL
jgi:hypothetical protein